jgi:hypothetical protein
MIEYKHRHAGQCKQSTSESTKHHSPWTTDKGTPLLRGDTSLTLWFDDPSASCLFINANPNCWDLPLVILELSLPQESSAQATLHSVWVKTLRKIISCPITLEFIRDPVMIVQLQQMSDPESLFNWLLEHLSLLEHSSRCPVSGQNFGTNFDFRDNLVTQQLLMHLWVTMCIKSMMTQNFIRNIWLFEIRKQNCLQGGSPPCLKTWYPFLWQSSNLY